MNFHVSDTVYCNLYFIIRPKGDSLRDDLLLHLQFAYYLQHLLLHKNYFIIRHCLIMDSYIFSTFHVLSVVAALASQPESPVFNLGAASNSELLTPIATDPSPDTRQNV